MMRFCRIFRVLVWLTTMVLILVPGRALQAGGLPPDRLSFKIYGADHGLGNQSPWALAQDGTGFIWVGTEDGLYRFDGQRFRVFGLKQGLPSAFVDNLHVDRQGILWVGTYNGLCRPQDDQFQVVGGDSGLPGKQITALKDGPDGQLWVGMNEGLFQRLPQGRFQPVPGWVGGAVTAMWSQPGSDAIWVASWRDSRATILRWDRAGWRSFAGGRELGRERIDALAVDGRGVVWARSLNHLWSLSAGGGLFELSADRLPAARQKGHLYVDPRGQLWVTTNQGLYRREGAEWRRLGPAEGLPGKILRAIMEDREGSLWVAGGAIFRLQGGGVLKAYTADHGLPNDVVWCVFRDKAGTLYAGTDGGLAKADGRGWRLVPGTNNFQVRSVIQGPDGALYVGGGPEILRLDARSGIRRFGSAQGVVTAGRIFRLLFDSRGDLWVATDGGGLLKGSGKGDRWHFKHQTIPGGTPTERFADIFIDSVGRLWAPGEKGLAMWDGQTWRRYTQKDGLRSDHANYIRGTRNGDLLFTYFEPFGMARATYSQGVFKVMEHLDGSVSPEKAIFSFAEDVKGNLWIGTGQGLDLLARDGRGEHFGHGEGLVSEDLNSMALLPEPNGDLWIGTSGGLARFDASLYKGPPKHPSTVILECRLGKDRVPVFSSQRIQVPHESNTFSVKFASLSFIREGSVRCQVRLEGLEPDWHFSDTLEERYPALPYGKYRFDARSRIAQGEWGPVSSYEFEVLPAWWETWWFRTLALLVAAGAILLIVRWRVDALHRRNRTLQEMVAARTREVEAKAEELERANEALRNQSLTDPLTGLRNRRYLGVCMPEDVAQVHRVHRDVVASRNDRLLLNIDLIFLMVDIDHFKFVNDHFGHAAGDQVLQQVAEILKMATRDSDTVVRWGGEEFLVVARNAARRDSAILAERIRVQMEAHDFLLEDGTHLRRTCSIGFTYYPFVPENPNLLVWEQVLDIADHCLFAAKRGGRNAWVGLFPTVEGDATHIKQALPLAIPELLATGDVSVATSLGDATALDWNLKG